MQVAVQMRRTEFCHAGKQGILMRVAVLGTEHSLTHRLFDISRPPRHVRGLEMIWIGFELVKEDSFTDYLVDEADWAKLAEDRKRMLVMLGED